MQREIVARIVKEFERGGERGLAHLFIDYIASVKARRLKDLQVEITPTNGCLAAQKSVLGGGQSYVHRFVPHGGFTDSDYGGVGLTEEQVASKSSGKESKSGFRSFS